MYLRLSASRGFRTFVADPAAHERSAHVSINSRTVARLTTTSKKLDKATVPATLGHQAEAFTMNKAPSLVPADEGLTWREICVQFPDEWVVLVDADWVDDHNFEFGSATVFAHRKHRREATSDLGVACGEFQNVGCFFTGRIRGPMPRFGGS
jgi:hypothetical protein